MPAGGTGPSRNSTWGGPDLLIVGQPPGCPRFGVFATADIRILTRMSTGFPDRQMAGVFLPVSPATSDPAIFPAKRQYPYGTGLPNNYNKSKSVQYLTGGGKKTMASQPVVRQKKSVAGKNAVVKKLAAAAPADPQAVRGDQDRPVRVVCTRGADTKQRCRCSCWFCPGVCHAA